MQKSQLESLALIGAVAASALALMLPVQYVWITGISGFALLFMLFSYQTEAERSTFQSLAFSSACGLAVMLLSDAFYSWLGGNGEIHMSGNRIATVWLPLTWLGGTLAIWAIDRVRLGRPTAATLPVGVVQRGFIPQYAEPVAQTPAPAPAQPVTVAPSIRPAQPVPVPAPQPVVAPAPAPFAPAAAPAPPAPAPPPAVAEPAAPAPVARPLPQTEIYVSLIGEGLNLMRTVRAEHVGRDFYKIIEEMPAGETWEFGPGQVVRCKKKSLSTGKGLVAFEEAPRAS